MTERSYQDAVQVLKDRLGGRWEGLETEGRDEMVKILEETLGYDRRAADDAIDAMMQSGVLRYHRVAPEPRAEEPRAEGDADVILPAVGPGGTSIGAGTSASSGLTGLPVAPAAIMNRGYWQIGPGDSEPSGRAGQVTPS